MITNIAGRELTQEDYTDQGKRYSGGYVVTNDSAQVQLFNNGEAGEKILVEKLIISTDTAVAIIWGGFSSIDGWSSVADCSNLKHGLPKSTFVHIYWKTPAGMIWTYGCVSLGVGQLFMLDTGGVVLENSKGLAVTSSTPTAGKIGISFVWRLM